MGLRGRPDRPHIPLRASAGIKGFTGGTGGAPWRRATAKANPGGAPGSAADSPRSRADD
ncbi:ligase [Pseudomonas aeruginosa]|nr:ligase [Pseudomonas aeruginosa]OPD66909.1 ligase [Pseudomonas paraeruginosa]OPD70317.1 ligase [Pseudomonas aeruginosa]OPD70904.1 ligase [Pseudomonas aeruginosa]OPD86386.1 ligase [Pseudomonas aeruginosa]